MFENNGPDLGTAGESRIFAGQCGDGRQQRSLSWDKAEDDHCIEHQGYHEERHNIRHIGA